MVDYPSPTLRRERSRPGGGGVARATRDMVRCRGIAEVPSSVFEVADG